MSLLCYHLVCGGGGDGDDGVILCSTGQLHSRSWVGNAYLCRCAEERKSGGGDDLVCPLHYRAVTFLPARGVEHAFSPCERHSVLNQSQKRIEVFYSPLMNKGTMVVILIFIVTTGE
jgi:hypothetical protein